jgi:hypothetical protein
VKKTRIQEAKNSRIQESRGVRPTCDILEFSRVLKVKECATLEILEFSNSSLGHLYFAELLQAGADLGGVADCYHQHAGWVHVLLRDGLRFGGAD